MAETVEGGVYKVGEGYLNAKGEKTKAPLTADAAEPETETTYPYADLLSAAGLNDWAAVQKATDEDLLAVDGIGPARLAEVRAYKG